MAAPVAVAFLARRVEHWRGIVASACEQCGRNRVPEVVEPTALGVDQVINMRSESTLNPDFSLRSFSFALSTDNSASGLAAPGRSDAGGTNLEIRGGVDGRRLRVVVGAPGEEGTERIIPVDGSKSRMSAIWPARLVIDPP